MKLFELYYSKKYLLKNSTMGLEQKSFVISLEYQIRE